MNRIKWIVFCFLLFVFSLLSTPVFAGTINKVETDDRYYSAGSSGVFYQQNGQTFMESKQAYGYTSVGYSYFSDLSMPAGAALNKATANYYNLIRASTYALSGWKRSYNFIRSTTANPATPSYSADSKVLQLTFSTYSGGWYSTENQWVTVDFTSFVDYWQKNTPTGIFYNVFDGYSSDPEMRISGIRGDANYKPYLSIEYALPPSSVSFSSISQNSMTVTWDTNGNPAGTIYELYRNGTTLLYTGTGTSFNDTGLSAGTTYSYKLRAKTSLNYYTGYSSTFSKITLPSTPATPTASVGGVSWSNDANNPGRGYVVLSWPAVTSATGYRVYMFDGNAYRMVQDVGAATTWSSHSALIYPSNTTLDSYGDNTQSGNLFTTPTTGSDLPDNPSKLYKKTTGTTYDSSSNYWFRVTAYNSSGESAQSNVVTPTLPDRTDVVAPDGTLVANDGAYNTTLKDITLTISGTDSESGCYQISLSNDNVSWSAWEAYATSKSWQIPVGQGSKTIYLKIKDNAGNVSNLISTTIYLKDDVTAPTITITINGGETTTDSTTITLTLTAVDDNTTPDLLRQRFSNNGTSWSGWEAISFTKSWTLTAGADGPRAVYYQVKDGVGNIQTAGDTITLSTAASEPESDPPTTPSSVGTVTINGVSYQISNSSQVMLRVNSPTNVAKARYSFDGITFSPWENVVISTDAGGSYFSKDLTFSPGDGYRAVYLQFANSYGKESNVAVNRYVLDQTAPDFTVTTTDGRTATATSSVSLLITPKDNLSTTFEYSVNGGVKTALPSSNTITVSGLTKSKLNTIKIRLYDGADNYTDKTFNIFYL